MPVDTTYAYASVLTDFTNSLLPNSLQIIIILAPVFLVFTLFVIFWELWMDYIRGYNFLNTKCTVLELKLPKETYKSPLAMEVFINALHNTAEGNLLDRYWDGKTRPWFSLEIISIEGEVKFIIWAPDAYKANLMSALYSQYPEIEIKEIDDYTKSVHFDPKILRIWGGEFEFTDKTNSFPIKTYVDYGLDKDPKEEFKVDPILPLIEYLGSVGPNQQVWIQIIIRSHKKEQIKKGHIFMKTDAWHDQAEETVNKMLLRDAKTKVAGIKDDKTEFTKLPTISKGEQNRIEAIERRVSKFAFDVGIRALYIAKKEVFSKPFGIGGIVGNMKHFSTEQLNGFKPKKIWHQKLEYPWDDFMDFRRNKFARLALRAYQQRSYFYTPFASKPLVMNAEEIATIYHFPGSVAKTPNLDRVPSKKAQAPGNLPI